MIGSPRTAISERPVAARLSERASLLCWCLVGATIGANILWVLARGGTRDLLTIAGVACFLAASLVHALATQGPRWTLILFAITAALGWAIEAIGTSTGYPFGDYQYGDRIGPELAAVPLLVPAAWAMMAYPSLLVASSVTRSRIAGWLLASALLASWDLFLDPQMVAEGHWTWDSDAADLPGIPGIPMTNFAGWILTALVLQGILVRIGVPHPATGPALSHPLALLTWVYVSSVLANAVFLDRPTVALVGGLVMGVPMAFVWIRIRTARRSATPDE